MSVLKNMLRPLIPKWLLARYRKPKIATGMWSGSYANWQQAAQQCDGYDSPQILEKCKNALLRIKNGSAVYERDSVLFDEKQYSWPLLALLQQIALTDGKLSVLDFGGSLGSTYYQNASYLSPIKELEWSIVEQDSFVTCGKAEFEDEVLKFYNSAEQCFKSRQPNILILSSVLQYLEDPFLWLEKLAALNIANIIIDRTSFLQDLKALSRLTIQQVPADIYKADYPCWFFNENDFTAQFPGNYKLITNFDSYADPDQVSDDGLKMYWKGFYFKRAD